MNKKKESKVVPNVRFKGFTDDWKQRKLGDIADVTKLAGFEFTEHVVYSDEGNIIALRGLNIKNGQLILDDVKYIDGSNFSKLSRSKLFIDDIMFTYVGTVGEVAIIKENDRFYLAPNVSRIRVKSDDSPKFISHYMRTDNFKNKVIFPLIATSSQPALSMENIRKFTINIPISREEQDCLAKYFDSLDRLITLHQQKITLLTKLKKAILEKMFPKKGSVIPEFRFNGFANAWEQRKLGDVAEIVRGASPRPISDPKWFDDNSDVGWLRISDVTNQNGRIHYLEQHISKLGQEKTRVITEPHLLLSIAATVGKPLINYVKTGVHDGFLIFLNPSFDLEYMYQWLEMFRPEWNKYGQPGSQVNLNSDLVKNQIIILPSEDEQKKISSFLKKFDHLITLHQRKIDKLKNLKKAMLDQMLI